MERMERYIKGRPRFRAGTINGQPGYAVFRLDGLWRDRKLTTVYGKIRTCRGAEKIATRLTENLVHPVNTRYHIPEGSPRLGPPDITVKEAAAQSRKSTDWVIRRFRNEPGVRRDGNSQRQVLTIPVAVYNRVMNRITNK
jgi:hypothetical protein